MEPNIKVYFTCGKNPVDLPSKFSLDVPGTYISENEIQCVTPSFE